MKKNAIRIRTSIHRQCKGFQCPQHSIEYKENTKQNRFDLAAKSAFDRFDLYDRKRKIGQIP